MTFKFYSVSRKSYVLSSLAMCFIRYCSFKQYEIFRTHNTQIRAIVKNVVYRLKFWLVMDPSVNLRNCTVFNHAVLILSHLFFLLALNFILHLLSNI